MLQFHHIQQACDRLLKHIRQTPVVEINHTEHSIGCHLYLKLDLHQVTGSFKYRGVMNKILSSDSDHVQKGLIAASGGNHGRAVAYAGHNLGIPTKIYLPKTTPQHKIDMIAKWGPELDLRGDFLNHSNQLACENALATGQVFIHPYADIDVAAGQGTMMLEIFESLKDLDIVIGAIGGGGLMSGVSTVAKHINPNIKVYGVEPVGCPTLYASLQAGKIVTIENIQTTVSTLAVSRTNRSTFCSISKNVDEIFLVSDAEMLIASQWLWNNYSIAAEQSGAAALSAILAGKVPNILGKKVCALVCGSGIDGAVTI